MLRKKEKKALALIFALLIGWPLGLDQFVAGNTKKGMRIFFGWIFAMIMIFWGISLLDPYYQDNKQAFAIFFMASIGMGVGVLRVFFRLADLLRDFVEAHD